MKRSYAGATLLMVLLVLSIGSVSSAQPTAATRARFINLYPLTPGLNAVIDNGVASVAIGRDITYPGASAITDIPPGADTFRLYRPGMSTPDFEIGLTAEEGFTYSFFLIQTAPGYFYLLYAAHPSDGAIDPDETAVRLLHASYLTGPVDIRFVTSDGSTPQLPELLFIDPTGHAALASGSAEVEVTSSNNGAPVFSAAFNFPPQEAVTLILAGGGDAGPSRLYMLVDTDTAEQIPLRPLAPPSSVRMQGNEAVRAGIAVHPNPSSEGAAISFDLPVAGNVRCAIYDQRGALVATPLDSWREQGAQSIPIALRTLPAGVYTVVLRGGGTVLTERLIITR